MQTIKLEFRIGNAMRVWLCAALLLGGSEMSPALAALTDISDVPITGSSSTVVKPNIMLVMDTSGSMGWGHMPDEVESVTGVGSVGYKSSQCNVLYYNPTTKYLLPKDATGTAFPIPSFTAAPVDAFDTTSSTTIDLSSSFRAYQTATLRTSGYNDTPQPAYYYVYTGSQSPVYSASPCTDVDTGVTKPAIGGGTWTRVVVSATSGTNSTIGPDERTNFAIWYAYYRTRIAMVKSAVSLAFQFSPATTANYRLGFITVQPKTLPTDPAIDSTKYVPMSDFNSTQRDLWFTKIFAQKPGGASPAREALARAGRYYAGKHDGINTGMDDDPVQYSCQQNFTIMTTDGYWNAQTESQLTYPYIGGAVQMDGKTLVGNQDHYLTDYVTQPTGLTPRPIWEGSATGTRTITDNQLLFTAAPCTRYNISTSQVRSSTTQNLQSNVQNLQSTVQNLKSTVQKLQSTSQNLQSTSQMTQYTTQALQSTTQKLKSTVQNLQSTSQTLQQTQQLQRSTVQNLTSTVQNLKSTTQNLQSTVQNLQSTSQKLQSTVQNLKSTTQNLQSTSQMTQYTTQSLQSTTQNLQSTTQNLQSTTQNLQSTSQILSCNAATELCTPVASCTSGGNISCSTQTSGPTPVASCTPSGASAGNNYTSTTCSTNSTTNVHVASCTPVAASAVNNWTTTSCPAPIVTTNVPVASCTASGATSGNNYTITTCSTNNTSSVPVASCTASAATSGNNWTTTTCGNNTSATVAVSSCSPVAASSANSYTATVCVPVTTTNVPVASCTAQTAASGNSWTTITCPAPVVTTNVPVASCTAAAASSSNSYTTTTCPAPITTTNVPVASCTAAAASSSNNYTTTTCPAPITTTNVPVASCTAQTAASGNNWVTITCGNSNTTNVPVATCTPQTASSANSWNTITCSNNNTSNVLVASCNASGPSSGNGYTTTICTTSTLTGPTLTDTCTPVTASASNAYTATNCQSVSGQKIVYSTQTTVNNTLMSGGLPVGLPSISTTTSGASDLQTNTCYTGTVGDNLPTLPGTQEAGLPVSGFSASAVGPTNWDPTCTGWPCTITTPSNDGSVNSLADVAQYYYVNDLRPASDWPSNIAQDDVSAVGTPPEGDFVKWQHMVTFTMALGYSGTLNYRPDYLTATTGDFADIRCTTWNPPTTNPLTGVTTKTCAASKPWPEWPDPSIDYTNANNWNDPKSIDDFWHTAVNGRGQYFSAGSPLAVVSGMTQALSGISAQLGTGSAVGVSTLQPVVGDNYLFLASYKTSEWVGNVQELTVDPNTGAINTTPNWSAQPILDTQTTTNCDYRNIYLIRQGAPNNLTPFTWNTSACDATGTPLAAVTSLNAAEQANFNATVVHQLSQYTSPSGVAAAAQAAAAVGANLVNFLRGQRGLEGYDPTDTTYSTSHLYRSRTHVLGDIVDGSPTYVRAPYAMYQDGVTPSYSSFQAAYANRIPMLYVPANDGMLHAFYVGTSASDPLAGKEAWAIIPSTVLPNLYELADAAYSSAHRYFVDGTVSVGDAFDQNGVVLGGGLRSWRTIVVGGFNKGGQGYYAVDVTDPTTPRALWEFKSTGAGCGVVGANCDQNLGYSFGQPSITKLMNGQWVVIVTSGYNNVPPLAPNGDGHGYLYVLDAFTGQIISKIDTGVGSTTTPSGLAQASSFVSDAAHDNTTLRVYGGDLLGNVWRFNINAPTPTATLIGTAVDNLGVAQPISTAPELGLKGGFPIVLVGTGLLLGPSDLSNVQLQSVYGIVDPLTVPSPGLPIYNALRTSLAHDSMSIDSSGNRTTFCDANCNSLYGWLLDLPSLGASAGERVNVNMQLVLGTLTFLTNQPSNSACSSGGYSFDNYVNYANGLPVKVASLVNGNVVINTLTGYLNSNSLVTGLATLTAGTGGSTGTGGLGGTSTSGNSCTGSNCTIGIGGACNAGTDCINGVCTGPNCSMSQFTCALATGVNGIVTCNGIPVVPLVPDGKRVSWHEIVQ